MTSDITIITTPFFLKVTVNCYLVNNGDKFILIDTGRSKKRRKIEIAIESAGCRPGDQS